MLQKAVFIFFIFCLTACSGVKLTTIKLGDELCEISGLAIYNDTLLIAHNDSGNDAKIFFLTKKGQIVHSCLLENVKNNDWEDITIDPNGSIYIADVGNNLNKRQNLAIVKVDGKKAFNQDTCKADLIHLSYLNQPAFPPEPADKSYDCESLAWRNDSLYLLTKPRNNPWKGYAYLYALSSKIGTYQLSPKDSIFIGPNGWKKDAPTAMDIVGDKALVLTYNRMLFYDIIGDKWKLNSSLVFKNLSQKEAIVFDNQSIFIAAEKHHLLGGPFLYIFK
jgi:hypothetical protein